MRRLLFGLTAAALTLPFAAPLAAQTKTLQGETVTITATVEAIEAATRTVTLKGPKGNYVDVVAPEHNNSAKSNALTLHSPLYVTVLRTSRRSIDTEGDHQFPSLALARLAGACPAPPPRDPEGGSRTPPYHRNTAQLRLSCPAPWQQATQSRSVVWH